MLGNKYNEDNTSFHLILDETSLHQYKVEERSDFDNSYFHDAYSRATSVVKEIVQANRKKHDKDDFANNIIVFDGERGTGKTSVMESFMSGLCEGLSELEGIKFHKLCTIKPAFVAKDSLLELIMAAMLSKWKQQKSEHNRQENNCGSNDRLLSQFDLVCRGNGTLHGYTNEQDLKSIYDLQLSTEVFQLKRNLGELIKLYLDSMSEHNEDQFLIIAIDDIDTEETDGVRMLEEVARYLMLPHVLVLITMRLSQMRLLLRNRNAKKFKSLYNYSSMMNKVNNSTEMSYELLMQIEDINSNYLEKIIPFTHRIIMPDLQSERYIIQERFSVDRNNKNGGISGASLKEFLKNILLKSTKYVLYTDSNYQGLTPNTLRQLIELSSSMLGAVNLSGYPSQRQDRNALLRQYITEIVEISKGSRKLKNILIGMQNLSLDVLNYHLLIGLCYYLYEQDEILYDNQRWYEVVNNIWMKRKFIRSETVTVSYVLFMLKIALTCCDNKDDKQILELLKVEYSLLLLQIYDDNIVLRMYSNDIIGMYYYGMDNSVLNRLYSTFVTIDHKTIELLSPFLEIVPQNAMKDNEDYIPSLLKDINYQEFDLNGDGELYRLSIFNLLPDKLPKNMNVFLGNLDIFMQWLENINQRMLLFLNRMKNLRAKLNDIGWCLNFVYTTAIDATKRMRTQEALPEEVMYSLEICERKMEEILRHLSEYEFKILRPDNEKYLYRNKYILFRVVKKKIR